MQLFSTCVLMTDFSTVRMLKTCVILLASLVCLSNGYGPQEYFSEFNLLRCMVPNPRAGEIDQPDTKEEAIPVLPFHVVYDDLGAWFQPLLTRPRSPVAGEFSARLRDHLLNYVGTLANIQLSSAGMLPPNVNPVAPEAPAGEIIPQRLRLVGDGIGPIVEGLQNHTDEINERLDELGIEGPDRQTILNVLKDLNDECVVVARWNRLPMGKFFPEWIYASYCLYANCSVPPGLSCEPVVKKEAIAHTLFLQWDCCWSFIGRTWVWECGWRKYRVAYIGRCDCACGVTFITGGVSEYSGVAKPSVITYNKKK